MIGEAIINLLYRDAPLKALVNKSIRPAVITPDDALPAIHVLDYQMEKMNCDANSGAYNGIIEIGIHGKNYATCVNILKRIRVILDDFTGVVDNVGLSILAGEQTADGYDETGTTYIKVLEYTAYAQNRN